MTDQVETNTTQSQAVEFIMPTTTFEPEKPAVEGQTDPEAPPVKPDKPVEQLPEAGKEQYDSIVAKPEDQRTDEEKALVTSYDEVANKQKYETLLDKPEEELTEDEKAFVADNAPKSIIDIAKNLAINNFGIDIGDDITNDEDGLANIFKNVYHTAEEVAVQSLLKEYPAMAYMHEYLSNGGTPEQYNATMYPEVDFSQIEILDADYDAEQFPEQDRTQTGTLMFDLTSQGYSEEQSQAIIADYETSGIKGKMAKMAQEKLVQQQSYEKANIVNHQKQLREKQIEDYNNYKESFSKKVKESKVIANLPVAEKDKDDFIKFKFNQRSDSTLKNVPISQELHYHALNPQSPQYNAPKYAQLRTFLEYATFMYDKDPEFINKLATNRAQTIRAKQSLPGFTPAERMATTENRASKGNQPDFGGQLII